MLGDDHATQMDALKNGLTRFSVNGVTLKLKKCQFGVSKIEYVGHIVTGGQGVSMNPKKVDALLAKEAPRCGSEVASLLGAAGYYSKFIKDYAMVVRPLRQLQMAMSNTMEKFGDRWGERQEAAFKMLKAMLSNAPVLVSPIFDGRPFIIMSDASDYGIGCCCAQYDDEGTERLVMFLSRELSKAERGFGISDKEGLGVTWAARKLKYLLHGSPTIIITDHSSLTHLMTKHHLVSARQRRFAMDLMEIQPLEIVHRAGKMLHLPDMLSRLGWGGSAPAMHQWMEANAEKIARHTYTQEEVDQEVKDQWGSWLKDTVAAVNDAMGEKKIARMNKEKHADGVTFGLIPEEGQAEAYSSAVEAYDYVRAVAM